MRLRHAILWVLLALLPLRGWAEWTMSAPLPNAQQQAAHEPAAMPCHDAGSADSAHACTLCDLCHCTAADTAQPLAPALPIPDVMPPPAVAHDTGRSAVGGLERPPRSILA